MKFHDVVISGGTIIQNNLSPEHRGKGFKTLKEAVVSSAFHDSGERFDPPKCHPKTRVAVIERIMDWINGEIDTETLVLWLYGPAGAGKSAIAQTIAELCHEAGLLLATFFFSSTDPSRNNIKSLFATLAYKAMFYVPAARRIIEQVVDLDPLIFECSLEAQFTRLILEPFARLFETGIFNQIPFPPVIIIDGLDECLDHAAQRATLAAFSKAGKQRRVPFKLLIISRPEQTIISSFKATPLKPLTHPLQLNDDYKPDKDVRTFLIDKFNELRSTHPLVIPPSWPSKADIDQLVAKSSGQFIYASIAIRFISSLRHHPRDRLNIVLGLCPPRRDLPFVELDALYTQIVSSSSDVGTLLDILGIAIVLAGMPGTEYMAPLPAGIIDGILDLEEGAFQLLLADINSLVEWDGKWDRIKFHHASCPDFLLDAQRSRDLHIEPSLIYTRLV
ncbi:hypothetical protein NLJ89_g2596 [Agrocybe chaxingu]|uniref:Nephrocystin 3-like N-terminal domain-containing protein n=1 Tax=Agrocybe chaxingu TaxID=84603 RepID=A0A9W8K6I8_9AGAR|nr:hypothetical protein NLJ89_g2596 [Agrocybe chaxingu]